MISYVLLEATCLSGVPAVGWFVSVNCTWGSWLLCLCCFRDVVSVPGRDFNSPLAMHHSPHLYIAQYRHFKSSCQPSPKWRSSKKAATHAVNTPSSFKGRNQTVFIWLPELLSSLFFFFYSFLSCLLKITYVYPFERILDVSRIFPGRCLSEFGGILCSIWTSSHI